eukprot:m.57689 g.57689  ORF g.57689 m.57689 type:complete len:81 (+) comp11618_c0_seq1:1130-1372(+)
MLQVLFAIEASNPRRLTITQSNTTRTQTAVERMHCSRLRICKQSSFVSSSVNVTCTRTLTLHFSNSHKHMSERRVVLCSC